MVEKTGKLTPATVKTQCVKDLENMGALGNHVWIFSKKGINQEIDGLRENVLKVLKKEDGTPIDELSVVGHIGEGK
ncbi:MAG TPA: hypothetical protein VNJ07_09205 [Chitinophagales bacterium]|nr:hypothetical protein [Chitinophagales bacterium]